MPNQPLETLKQFDDDLKSLRRRIKAESVTQIAKKSLRRKAEELGTTWFSDIVPHLSGGNRVDPAIVERYSEQFGRLIQLSRPSNLKASHIEVLGRVTSKFRDELILPIQTAGEHPSTTTQLEAMLKDVTGSSQSEYLAEAVACARYRLFKGAAVLGWCAAIDQIHHAIERIGFQQFNATSAFMTNQTKGRFKKFNQEQNVSTLSELREVFDTTGLWVLEGLQIIDSNQHTRLRSCFELRCQCAHPGEAPVTEYNLLSFFSDLKEIVFRNPKFAS